MAKNTSLLLGEHFDKFISCQIASGKYNSASEVMRTALRMLEHEEKRKAQLRDALITGERSGFVKNFDPEEYLRTLKTKRK